MSLHERLIQVGGVFYRWRSYTPLVVLLLIWLERHQFTLILDSPSGELVFEIACLSLAWTGELVRIIALGYSGPGTSGRGTRSMHTPELNTLGIYSITRNPIYLGNFIIFMGITLLAQSWELLLLNALLFACQYVPIILAEEQFLSSRFPEQYSRYQTEVPCFMPKPSLWRSSTRPWSWRIILKKEPDSIMALMAMFIFLVHLRSYSINENPGLEWHWLGVGLIVTAGWLVLKGLKKHTELLDEDLVKVESGKCPSHDRQGVE
jgi:protein-S-isoprenylcysteine O-methyltransferase Ste14